MAKDAQGNTYHITLEIGDVAYGFQVVPNISGYTEQDISDFAPRVAAGALNYRDLSIWQVWAMEDWRHGFGQPYFIDESAYAKTGNGVDTRHKEIAQLATTITSSEEDEAVTKFVDFNGKVYALQPADGGVRVYTPGTDSWADTSETTGTILDGLAIGSYLIVAPDGARIRKMATDGTFSNAGNDANPPEDMAHLCLHGGYLWASEDGSNWLHYTSAEDASTLEGAQDTDVDAIQVGPGDIPIVNMISYGGQLYVAREDGIWIIGDNNEARLFMDFSRERHADNFRTMAVFQGQLYFSVRQNLNRWAGSTIIQVTPPRYSETFPYHTYGEYKNLTPRGPFLYCTARDNEDTWHESLLCYDGVGWHKLRDLATESYVVNAFDLSTTTDRMWLNYTGTATTTGYIPLQSLSELPYASYDVTGNHYLYTSKFHAGFIDVDKVFKRIKVRTNNCSATQTISVDYQVDDSGDWVNLGQITEGPLQELDFPDPSTETTYGKFIQLRFDFQTASATNSPILESFAVHYLLRPEAVWGWQISLAIASNMRTKDQGIEREIRAKDLRDVLKTARDQKTPVTLVDPWGDEYSVYLSSIRFLPTEWRPENEAEDIEMIARVSLTDAS